MGKKGPCVHLTVGRLDCQHQIKTEKCLSLSGKACSGNTHRIGHDVPGAKALIEAQKKVIAIRKLEESQST